jgi:hypothetical protein
MAERFLSPKELSEHLDHKISPKTLANWRNPNKPRGPAFRRVGNKILYPMSAIEAWEQTGVHWSPKSKHVPMASRAPTERPAPPAPAAPPAEQPVAGPPAARAPVGMPTGSPVAVFAAARDDVRGDMAARQEALRRMAARLERHYSRRIDLVRGRLVRTAGSGS